MKFTVEVTQLVEVELDESKFTPEFMQEFRDEFYQFHSLTEHAEHIAQLNARGIVGQGFGPKEFIEGYGEAGEMGIRTRLVSTDMETIERENS